jgi:hypothetical protein
MMETPLVFRPYAEVAAVYVTGLASVAVTPTGDLVTVASGGIRASWGVSGTQRWRHTQLGLDYNGSLTHFAKQTAYDSMNQSLLFGVTHQFTRHLSLVLRESAGTFSTSYTLPALSQTVPFDPISSYIPATDFFNNRTSYLTTQADLQWEKSQRLSFAVGGYGSIVHRASASLFGTKAAGAHGDFQYRLTRRSTVGFNYIFSHYEFTKTIGGSDAHGFRGDYSIRVSRNFEFSVYAGPMRVESTFLHVLPVDPIIAAILGISSTVQLTHSIATIPSVGGRISRQFAKGVAYVSGGHDVTPGNGLFQTSYMTSLIAGYTYTGVRRWAFNATAGYSNAESVGIIPGHYDTTTQLLSVSRQIARSMHLRAEFSGRQYGSNDYVQYNRPIFEVRLGMAFSPGDMPFRMW